MWSSDFSFGLRVERHWSLIAGVVLVTLAAFIAIWRSPLPPGGALLLTGIAGLLGCGALCATERDVHIRVDVAGRIRTGEHGSAELQIAGEPWILPGVATGFRLVDRDGRVFSIILLRGQLSTTTWRRLLVCIRGN